MEAQFAVFQDSRIEVTLYLAQRASAPALAIFFIAFLFLAIQLWPFTFLHVQNKKTASYNFCKHPTDSWCFLTPFEPTIRDDALRQLLALVVRRSVGWLEGVRVFFSGICSTACAQSCATDHAMFRALFGTPIGLKLAILIFSFFCIPASSDSCSCSFLKQVATHVVARIYMTKMVLRFLFAILFAVWNFLELVVFDTFNFHFECGEENFRNNGIDNPKDVFHKLHYRWVIQLNAWYDWAPVFPLSQTP